MKYGGGLTGVGVQCAYYRLVFTHAVPECRSEKIMLTGLHAVLFRVLKP